MLQILLILDIQFTCIVMVNLIIMDNSIMDNSIMDNSIIEYNLQREELKFFPFNFYIRNKSKKSNN